MNNFKLRNLFTILIAAILAMTMPLQSRAANKTGVADTSQDKEPLVLMPLRVPEEDKNLTGAMETALVEGLQQKYSVFSGEQVSQKAHQIFLKESRNMAHAECDETRCMQNIAEAFQSELIATANVTKQDGSYFLALSIQNIFDNKVVYSKSLPCENCKAVQVIDKLKLLTGMSVPPLFPAPAAVNESPSASSYKDADAALWEVAQKRNLPEDYKLYLDTYPNGRYAPRAKLLMEKIKADRKANNQVLAANYTIGNPKPEYPQGGPNLKDCHDDTARLCRGIVPGQGRIIACLKNNFASLSSECALSLAGKAQHKKQNSELRQPKINFKDCRDDTERLCRRVKPGEGRIIACLKSNAEALSSKCSAALFPQSPAP